MWVDSTEMVVHVYDSKEDCCQEQKMCLNGKTMKGTSVGAKKRHEMRFESFRYNLWVTTRSSFEIHEGLCIRPTPLFTPGNTWRSREDYFGHFPTIFAVSL